MEEKLQTDTLFHGGFFFFVVNEGHIFRTFNMAHFVLAGFREKEG